jgi:hypothetical protein
LNARQAGDEDLQALKAGAIIHFQENPSTSTSLPASLHPASNPQRSPHLHFGVLI